MPAFVYQAGQNDDAARDRVFYLLKKYTSATLLHRAINLYRESLRDFEREISRPKVDIDYSGDLLRFLRFLEPMEYAEPLVANPAHRVEAFGLLRGGAEFGNYIWGRRYQELGAADPSDLFYKLGYREDRTQSTGIFGKISLSGALFSLLFGSLNKEGRVYLGEPSFKTRIARCWTYESIFFDDIPFNLTPPITFPSELPACPHPNEQTEGQVWSGGTIPTTGIWEPWPLDPNLGVRCPNFFLAADKASQYQFEGTDTLEDVRWRLIWKDNRYEDGCIPAEEACYFENKFTRDPAQSLKMANHKTFSPVIEQTLQK